MHEVFCDWHENFGYRDCGMSGLAEHMVQDAGLLG